MARHQDGAPRHRQDHTAPGQAQGLARAARDAGVRIYQYQSGFVHAKTMVVDRWVGTIGSANLDTRSFDLNFELNVFLQDEDFADQLRAQFEEDLTHAREWTSEDEAQVGIGMRILRALARLASPLL